MAEECITSQISGNNLPPGLVGVVYSAADIVQRTEKQCKNEYTTLADCDYVPERISCFYMMIWCLIFFVIVFDPNEFHC